MTIAITVLCIFFTAFWALTTTKNTDSPKCSIELVPWEMHGLNVRSRLSPLQWKQIGRHVFSNANGTSQYRCQQCGESGLAQGFKHPVECHEVWDYDEVHRTQRLTGLLCLCPLCHKVKHIGLAKRHGFEERAMVHMSKHNDWTEDQADKYIRQAKAICKARSGAPWKLDLTYLNRPEFAFLETVFTSDEGANCDSTKVF